MPPSHIPTCLSLKTKRRLGESLTRNPSTSTSGAQTRADASLSRYRPRNEVILRWDPHGKFIRFNEGNKLVQHLMVNYSKAKRTHENRDGGIGSLLQPHQTLTITGTESDEKTSNRSRYEVFDFLAELGVNVRYVPDYGWTYSNMPDGDLELMVDCYIDRVNWLYEQINEEELDHIELIPLAKGLHRDHYQRAVEIYEKHDIDRIAMYGVQTPNIKKFVRRVEQAINVIDPEGVLVIGKQSPEDVRRLPDRVDGTAGFWNWKTACNLTKDGYSSEALEQWHHKISRATRNGRTTQQIDLQTASKQEVESNGRR